MNYYYFFNSHVYYNLLYYYLSVKGIVTVSAAVTPKLFVHSPQLLLSSLYKGPHHLSHLRLPYTFGNVVPWKANYLLNIPFKSATNEWL